MNKEKYYITTPIYYPSANFHIGHCYTTIIADAIARYKRLKGYDVFFQTGTDEHGQKIEKKAQAAGVTPKQYVDKIVDNAKDLWKSLDISYDYFIRTSDERHIKQVQKIFKKLYDNKDIYKGEYKGLYCTPCESFWTETQLVDHKCPDCGREIEEVSEEAYFLKLSKYQDRLVKYYDEHPNFIQPISRKNEMINNFIKPGLEDLCVSRTSIKWGIPVDFDNKHTIYVWIDALSNYITSLGYAEEDNSMFLKYWPADLHLVGKEIIRFHTIIWPIILMALELPLPKQVFGHGWLVMDGGKISKSSGNYKDPREYIKDYGIDCVRYFALKEVPFGSDGTFSEEAMVNRYNSDLANILGNLVNRTMNMNIQNFGKIIQPHLVKENVDDDLISSTLEIVDNYYHKFDELKVNEALDLIFDLLRKANKYIDDTTPWSLAKDESQKERLGTILRNIFEVIRVCTTLLQPFIPNACHRIYEQLNLSDQTFESLNEFYRLEDGAAINDPKVLFERIK